MAQCQFVKSNNEECQAQALLGEDYCLFHSSNQKVIEKRLRANAKGGSNNQLWTGSPIFKLKTVGQIIDLLEFTTNSLLQGKISREKASCVGYLTNIMIGAIKANCFEQRLEVIDSVLNIPKQASEGV